MSKNKQPTKAFTRKPCVIATGFALSLMAAQSVYAQQSAQPDAAQKVERIEVTGSSIKRIQSEGALPVQVITRVDIERSGAKTVTDLIQAIPAMQGFTVSADSVNGGGGGIATASLRSLGNNYTLVLLNGRRLAPSTTGSVINLNNLPLSAIERVEVLTDGASALYGSDAVAGVVNFILRKNTTEGSAEISYLSPQDPGAKSLDISISKGFGDLEKDGFNVLGAYSQYRQDELTALQRSFSKSGKIPFSFNGQSVALVLDSINSVPGNISLNRTGLSGVTFNPFFMANNNCPAQHFAAPSNTGIAGQPTTICRFDFASTVQIVPESERQNFFLTGRIKLGADWTLFGEYVGGKYWNEPRFAPPAQPLPLSLTSPLYARYVVPYLARLGVTGSTVRSAIMRLRVFDAGGRQDRYTYDTNHFVVGADGTLAGWDVSGTLTESETKFTQEYKGGYLSGIRFNEAVSSGRYDPFLPAGGSVAALAPAVLKELTTSDKSSITNLALKGSRAVFQLPAGEAAFGAGYDYIKQRYLSNPSAIAQGENALQPNFADVIIGGGQGALPFDTTRDVNALFGELVVPVIKGLDVTGAVRYDDYAAAKNSKNFDPNGVPIGTATQGNKYSKTTYKLSARYEPTKDLLFRASAGTGFRAPTLANITQPFQDGGVTSREYNCPFPNPSDPLFAGCQGRTQYNLRTGGNPAQGAAGLRPETTKQWAMGFRFEPVAGYSFGVDYWDIRLKDKIDTLPETVAFGSPEAYRALFRVLPDTVSKLPYITLLQGPINLTKANYAGFDLDASARIKTSVGILGLRATAAYLTKAEYEVPGTAGLQSSLGQYGVNQQVAFRWITKLTANFDHGNFAHSVTTTYRSGYTDAKIVAGDGPNVRILNADGSLGANILDLTRQVPSYTTVDWQTRYAFTKQIEATIGVRNLLDKSPPLSIQDGGSGNQRGFDPRYTDPIGRTFIAKAVYRF